MDTRRPAHLLLALALGVPALGCPVADDGNDGVDSTPAATTTGAPETEGATVATGDGSSGDMPSGSDTDTDTDAATDADDTSAGACGTPVELGSFAPTDGDARGFALVDDLAYLSVTSGGIEVVDISVPASTTSVGVLDFDLGELAFDVAVDGAHAYVAMRGSGWKVVDITDPAAMAAVYTDSDTSAETLAVADGTLFVLDAGLSTFDIADPATPVLLADDVPFTNGCNRFALHGTLALLACNELVAVDVSDPAVPTELSKFETSGGLGRFVVADGDTAYVSHNEGVDIVDITDPTAPALLGAYALDRAHAIAVDGGILYAFGDDSSSFNPPTVSVVDISDPGAPVAIDTSFDAFEEPFAAQLLGDQLIFTAEDDDALHILDACPEG